MENNILNISIKIVDILEKISLDKKVNHVIKIFSSGVIGEPFYFQIVINSNIMLFDSKIKIISKNGSILKINKVGFVPCTTPYREDYDDYILNEKLVGDVLEECDLERQNISPFFNHVYCVKVLQNDKNVFSDTIEAYLLDNNCKSIAHTGIKIDFHNINLPDMQLIYTNWFHYDCISIQHKVKPFSENFYKVFEKYLMSAVETGQNMLYVPLFTPPLDTHIGGERTTIQLVEVELRDDSYFFNFDKLKKFLLFAIEKGIKYFEFSHLFTQWGAKSCPKIIVKENGKKIKMFGWKKESLGFEYKKFLKYFLPELNVFLINNNFKNNSFFHISDEPNNIEHYDKCCNLVKQYLGNDSKIIDAISNYEYYKRGIINTPIVAINHFDEFNNNGIKNLYVYYCWEHYKNYQSNRLFCMAFQRVRIFGIQLYANDVKMFLHWGYNFFNDFLSYNSINPYYVTDAGGVFPSGDAFVVYPDYKNYGVKKSLRLIAIEQGFFDYRLLQQLEKQKSKQFVAKLIKDNGISGFNIYPHSNKWHNDFIKKIIDLLEN